MQAMNADTTKINIQTTQQSGAAIADDVKDTLCEGLTAAADALTQLRVPDDAMTTKESAAAIVVNADPTLAPAVHGALENAVSFNGDIAVVANALTRAADDLESSISPSSSSAAASPAGLPAGAGGHIDSIDITALLNRPTEDSFGRPIDPQSKTQAIARLDAVISALDMPIVENPDLKGLVTVSVKSTEAGSTSEKTVPIGEYVKGLKTERGKLADCVKIEAYSGKSVEYGPTPEADPMFGIFSFIGTSREELHSSPSVFSMTNGEIGDGDAGARERFFNAHQRRSGSLRDMIRSEYKNCTSGDIVEQASQQSTASETNLALMMINHPGIRLTDGDKQELGKILVDSFTESSQKTTLTTAEKECVVAYMEAQLKNTDVDATEYADQIETLPESARQTLIDNWCVEHKDDKKGVEVGNESHWWKTDRETAPKEVALLGMIVREKSTLKVREDQGVWKNEEGLFNPKFLTEDRLAVFEKMESHYKGVKVGINLISFMFSKFIQRDGELKNPFKGMDKKLVDSESDPGIRSGLKSTDHMKVAFACTQIKDALLGDGCNPLSYKIACDMVQAAALEQIGQLSSSSTETDLTNTETKIGILLNAIIITDKEVGHLPQFLKQSSTCLQAITDAIIASSMSPEHKDVLLKTVINTPSAEALSFETGRHNPNSTFAKVERYLVDAQDRQGDDSYKDLKSSFRDTMAKTLPNIGIYSAQSVFHTLKDGMSAEDFKPHRRFMLETFPQLGVAETGVPMVENGLKSAVGVTDAMTLQVGTNKLDSTGALDSKRAANLNEYTEQLRNTANALKWTGPADRTAKIDHLDEEMDKLNLQVLTKENETCRQIERLLDADGSTSEEAYSAGMADAPAVVAQLEANEAAVTKAIGAGDAQPFQTLDDQLGKMQALFSGGNIDNPGTTKETTKESMKTLEACLKRSIDMDELSGNNSTELKTNKRMLRLVRLVISKLDRNPNYSERINQRIDMAKEKNEIDTVLPGKIEAQTAAVASLQREVADIEQEVATLKADPTTQQTTLTAKQEALTAQQAELTAQQAELEATQQSLKDKTKALKERTADFYGKDLAGRPLNLSDDKIQEKIDADFSMCQFFSGAAEVTHKGAAFQGDGVTESNYRKSIFDILFPEGIKQEALEKRSENKSIDELIVDLNALKELDEQLGKGLRQVATGIKELKRDNDSDLGVEKGSAGDKGKPLQKAEAKQDRLNTAIDNLTAEDSDLEGRIAKFKTDATALQDTAVALTGREAVLRGELADAVAAANTTIASLADPEGNLQAALDSAVRDFERKLDTVKVDIDTNKARADALTTKAGELEGKYNRKVADIQTAADAAAAAQAKFDAGVGTLGAQITQLQTDNKDLADNQVAPLERDLTTAKTTFDSALKGTPKERLDANQQLENKASEISIKAEGLKREVDVLQDRAAVIQTEIEALNPDDGIEDKRLDNKQKQEALTQKLEDVDGKIRETEARRAELVQNAATLGTQAQGGMKAAQSEIDAAAAAAARAAVRMSQRQANLGQLLGELKAENDQRKGLIDQTNQRFEDIKTQLNMHGTNVGSSGNRFEVDALKESLSPTDGSEDGLIDAFSGHAGNTEAANRIKRQIEALEREHEADEVNEAEPLFNDGQRAQFGLESGRIESLSDRSRQLEAEAQTLLSTIPEVSQKISAAIAAKCDSLSRDAQAQYDTELARLTEKLSKSQDTKRNENRLMAIQELRISASSFESKTTDEQDALIKNAKTLLGQSGVKNILEKGDDQSSSNYMNYLMDQFDAGSAGMKTLGRRMGERKAEKALDEHQDQGKKSLEAEKQRLDALKTSAPSCNTVTAGMSGKSEKEAAAFAADTIIRNFKKNCSGKGVASAVKNLLEIDNPSHKAVKSGETVAAAQKRWINTLFTDGGSGHCLVYDGETNYGGMGRIAVTGDNFFATKVAKDVVQKLDKLGSTQSAEMHVLKAMAEKGFTKYTS